jgi:hypothetical protein
MRTKCSKWKIRRQLKDIEGRMKEIRERKEAGSRGKRRKR